ncbi:MAG: acyl-CoA thioesterase [Sideroxyarcus sp.]|nr:acyl-CoA thioesterase [Sideroxyarcus sp.]
MRLRLRLLLLVLSSFWKKPLRVLDESVITLTVLPNDIDISKISDDRYFALMDLGRMDIAFRLGMLKLMFRNNWVPLVTFNTIRFRYSLKIFQRYQLKTRIVWWDDTTFYWKQIFERKGKVVATGYVCGTVLGPNGPVPSAQVLGELRQSITKPSQPEIVARLKELEGLIHDTQKEKC